MTTFNRIFSHFISAIKTIKTNKIFLIFFISVIILKNISLGTCSAPGSGRPSYANSEIELNKVREREEDSDLDSQGNLQINKVDESRWSEESESSNWSENSLAPTIFPKGQEKTNKKDKTIIINKKIDKSNFTINNFPRKVAPKRRSYIPCIVVTSLSALGVFLLWLLYHNADVKPAIRPVEFICDDKNQSPLNDIITKNLESKGLKSNEDFYICNNYEDIPNIANFYVFDINNFAVKEENLSTFEKSLLKDAYKNPYLRNILETLKENQYHSILSIKDPKYIFDGKDEELAKNISYIECLQSGTEAIDSTQEMFKNYYNLLGVNLEKIDLKWVTTMQDMFYGCTNLVNFNLQTKFLPVCKNMSGMFYNCSSLNTPFLTDFLKQTDVSKVEDMSYMFSGCSNVMELDLSNLNFANTKTMAHMFDNCQKLKNIKFPDTINELTLQDISYMFMDCINLNAINMNKFTFSNITNMSGLFYRCKNLGFVYATELNNDIYKRVDHENLLLECEKLNKFCCKEGDEIENIFTGTPLEENLEYVNKCYINGNNMCLKNEFIDKLINRFSDYGLLEGIDYVFEDKTDEDLNFYVISLNNSCFLSIKNLNYEGLFSDLEDLTKIQFIQQGTTQLVNMKSMFANDINLSTINLSLLDTTEVEDMSKLFYNCPKLINIVGLDNLMTDNVKDMSYMFYGCSSLQNLFLLSFNTEMVEDMSYMFGECSNLNNAYLNNFNTESLTNIKSMFKNCYSLETVNMDSFDFSRIKDISYLFENCAKLKNIYAKNLEDKIFSQASYTGLVQGCNDLNTVCVPQGRRIKKQITAEGKKFLYSNDCFFEGENVCSENDLVNMLNGRFRNLGFIEEIDYSWSDKSDDSNYYVILLNDNCYLSLKSLNFNNLFNNLPNLVSFRILQAGTTGIYSMRSMFENNIMMTTIDLNYLDTTKIVDMSRTFYNCQQLKTITGLENLVTNIVIDMSYMFYGCKEINNLIFTNFNTRNVTNMSYMFYGCETLTNLYVNSFDTSKVTNFEGMFQNCYLIEEIDIDKFTFGSAKNIASLFNNCLKLTHVYAKNLNDDVFQKALNYNFMDECVNLNKVCCSQGNKIENIITDLWGEDILYFSEECYIKEQNPVEETEFMKELEKRFDDLDYKKGVDYFWEDKTDDFNFYVIVFNSNFYLSIKNINHKALFSALSDVVSIKFLQKGGKTLETLESMFSDNKSLQTIDLSILDISNVTTLSKTFYNCTNLEFIVGLEKFITQNVFDMSYMFSQCTKLGAIILNNFNTNKVYTMEGMFSGCSNLSNLYLNNFSTGTVQNMNSMFKDCTRIETIDIDNFIFTNIQDLSSLFENCYKLTHVNAKNLNESILKKVIHTNIIKGCTTLNKFCCGEGETINALLKEIWQNEISYDSETLCYLKEEASTCESGEFVKILKERFAGYNFKEKVDFFWENKYGNKDFYVFLFNDNCYLSIKNLNFIGIFSGLKDLITLKLLQLGALRLLTMESWFAENPLLELIDLNLLDTLYVTTMYKLFYKCEKLKQIIGLEKFNTKSVVNMGHMFYRCLILKEINLINFNTYLVKNMQAMFYQCENIEILKIEYLVTTRVTAMDYMFYGCGRLKNLNFKNFNTYNVINMEYMFYGCVNIVNLDLDAFDTSNVVSMRYMFGKCSSLQYLYGRKFHSNKLQFMASIFEDCYAIETIIFGDSFVPTTDIKVSYIFLNNVNLKNIHIKANHLIEKELKNLWKTTQLIIKDGFYIKPTRFSQKGSNEKNLRNLKNISSYKKRINAMADKANNNKYNYYFIDNMANNAIKMLPGY